jgi:hypothetical protein
MLEILAVPSFGSSLTSDVSFVQPAKIIAAATGTIIILYIDFIFINLSFRYSQD